MKKSEARILVFIYNAEKRFKFAREISQRLNIDYGYLIRLLGSLKMNNLLTSFRRENRVYYELVVGKEKNTIKEALERLNQDKPRNSNRVVK